MKYKDFFNQYGAAYRTKNLRPPNYWRKVLRGRLRRTYREFPLPRASTLPPQFIRLCPWEGEYLFSVARRARVGIVEIGRYNGGSTFLMACAAPDAPIYSVDRAPQDDDRLRRIFEQSGVGVNVHLVVGDSQRERPHGIGSYDLLFIDGDHSYEGCSADIATWYGGLAKGGHILFHDSSLDTPGVQDAIADFIAAHPEVQVLLSPFMGASYWENQYGSIAHIIKR